MAISVALACLAGYALAIYRFRVALPLFFLFVAGNFIPFQILMVPVRDMSVQTGLYDTIAGQLLFHAAFQTGFCTLFMRNFIKALPFDLVESARIEGVSEWRIFWYVMLPLVRPAIAALAVLIFTFVWNDFFWANVLTQGESAKPITAGVRALNGQFVNNWHLVSAASLLAAIPPVVMFFLMQKALHCRSDTRSREMTPQHRLHRRGLDDLHEKHRRRCAFDPCPEQMRPSP